MLTNRQTREALKAQTHPVVGAYCIYGQDWSPWYIENLIVFGRNGGMHGQRVSSGPPALRMMV